MARSPRPDIDDGWHHVMNRGVDHQQVFFTDSDGRMFLALAAESAARAGVDIHAYCLMKNHFHLIVHCPSGGLVECMQRLGARFTQAQNQRRERDGPIFRGRYRSCLIDTSEYLDVVGRYVHRNPFAVVPRVPLDAYKWSSYAAYVGTTTGPDWLRTDVLAEMHAGVDGYREFVESEATTSASPTALRWAVRAAVDDFDLERARMRRDQVERTIALVLASEAVAPAVLGEFIGDLSPGALRTATSRARHRVAEQPWLAAAVAHARRLAA